MRKAVRDRLLFVVGMNTGLRISDLLELQVDDFLDDHQQVRRRFWIKDEKRSKRQEVVTNASIRDAFEDDFVVYLEITDHQNNFIFFNTKDKGVVQPIRPGQTWGYHARKQGVDLALIRHRLKKLCFFGLISD
jgi:integrase